MHIRIDPVTAPTEDVRTLLAELDAALSGPYAADQRHALSIEQLFTPGIRFFVAQVDGVAASCGGVALLDGYAELKRMYARPAVRGRGVAQALLRRLEAEARDAGTTLLRLETGLHQEAAMRFYEREGFRRREAFGHYLTLPPHAIELSIFYEKSIAGAKTT
jgi:putative acetyltransferase